MQFTYDEFCGAKSLEIKDDVYKYLIKARRHKIDDEIYFRNLKDNNIYLYKLINIDRRSANFELLSYEEKIVKNSNLLHLAWCVVDPKTVEKHIASLNELGVEKITFIYSDYSQNNFKINIDKLEKIMINSSSQCGRSDIIKIDTCESMDKFLEQNNEVYFLDFSQNLVDDKKESIKTLVVGCEGGFSSRERELFNKDNIVGLNSNLILRSETAVITVSGKIIV